MATWSVCEEDNGKKLGTRPLYVNLDNVLSISQKSEGSVVILLMVNGERLHVMGSPEKIIEGGTKQD